MAFDPESFAKDTLKSPINKLVNSVVSKVTSGLPGNSKAIASSLSEALFNAGASFDSVQAITSLKTDNIVSRGSSDYQALAGKVSAKATSSDIARSRVSSTSKEYFSSINPKTKIEKKNDTLDSVIIAII